MYGQPLQEAGCPVWLQFEHLSAFFSEFRGTVHLPRLW